MRRAIALFGVALSCALSASAQTSAGSYEYERPIVSGGRGAQKLRVDVPLLIGAQPFATVTGDGLDAQARDGLGDLRLFDRAGREVPYLLIDAPSRRARWIDGAILPIAETRKTSGFEVDLGGGRRVDAMTVEGLPAPFLKRLLLEASGDRARWTVLAAQGTLFDLPDDRVRQTTIEFTPGTYRYLRVTWDDTNSGRVPLPSRTAAREATTGSAPAPLRATVEFERQPSEPGRTRYRVQLPARGLPVTALVLDAGAGDVFRTATVLESRFSGERADPGELGRSRLVQTGRAPGTPSTLRIPIQTPRGSELQLVVDDGDNRSLELASIAVELAALPWIYFEAADAGPLLARYGSRSATGPRYDLEARRGAVNLDSLEDATWGEPRATSDAAPAPVAAAAPDRGARIDAADFAYARVLPPGGSGLVTLQLDAAVLAHSRGPAGAFGDVRIVDDEGYQVPYLLERRDEPLSVDLTIQPATPKVRALSDSASRNHSIHAIDLPYPNLPGPRVVLETRDRLFRRPLQVGVERPADRRHRDVWFDELTSTVWQHADQARGAAPLELAVASRDATRLLIVVDEGDNRPLQISTARLLLPSWRLRFFRPEGGLRLVYGRSDAAAPRYDLALLAPAVLGASAREIAAGPEAPVASERPAILSPTVFWIGLALAVVVLLGLIVRLIATGTSAR